MASKEKLDVGVSQSSAPDYPPESSKIDANANARPECFKSTVQEIVCIFVLTMGLAQSSLAGGSCQVITTIIGKALNMSSGQITWINSSNNITAGSFVMLFGTIADTFGRKRQLLFGFLLFAVSVLICGVSNNPIMFFVFRGLGGLASAASTPAAIGTLGAIYSRPSSRKNKAFACFSAGNPMGFVIGSIMSGVATEKAGWRAPFYVLTVIYVTFAFLCWMVVPDDENPVDWKMWRYLDWFGAGLVTVGLVGICAALTLAGNAPQGWKTPYIPVLLVVGFLLIGAFLYYESRIDNPIMPLHIWKNRTFSLLMVTVCVGFMSFTSCLFWLSLYLQQILRLSPLKTAIHLIPQAISALVVNVLAAFALSRIDNRLLLMIGTISYVASAALYATMSSTSSYWAFIFPGLIISVIGADLQYNVSNMYVLGSLPKALQSTAGGLFNTVLQLSSAVGLGMSTAVWEGVAGETGKDGALDPEVRGRMEKGYTAMFWFVCALSGMALFGQWHLKIGTQGYVAKDPVGSVEVVVVEDEIEEKEKTDDLDGGRGLRV